MIWLGVVLAILTAASGGAAVWFIDAASERTEEPDTFNGLTGWAAFFQGLALGLLVAAVLAIVVALS